VERGKRKRDSTLSLSLLSLGDLTAECHFPL